MEQLRSVSDTTEQKTRRLDVIAGVILSALAASLALSMLAIACQK